MKISVRLYEDYWKKSRLNDYQDMLEHAKKNGYEMAGILDFYKMVKNGELSKKFYDGDRKLLINRHDIDTSPRVARKMFEIEKQVYGKNASATYYFRDSTVDIALIRELEQYGYETGYHYENIAKFEKRKKLKNVDKIKQYLPQIRTRFRQDLNNFRIKTGSRSLSVASHGDFINVKYSLSNTELLNDSEIRTTSGILVEAYDEKIMRYVEQRFADHILLGEFVNNVKDGIKMGTKCIMILTHPRNWEVDRKANNRENFVRFFEAVQYKK